MNRTITSRIGLGIASGALAAAALTGQASAAQTGTTQDSSGNQAGLTSAERAQLDAEVAQTLRDAPGGERIGPNQIAWPDKGAVMTIPFPGEKRARTADEPIRTRGDGCSYKHVCVYDDADYEGREIEFYYCKFQKLRWYDFTNETSSWVNNQADYEKSTLDYWTGSEVATLDELWAPSYTEYLAGSKNNRADFVHVC